MEYQSRAKRLDKIMEELNTNVQTATSQAYDEINELKNELDSWKTGLEGTNLENSQKYSQLEDAIDALETLADDIQQYETEVPTADVTFPGMYN